ncbi:ESX secretion-associated protein EspG [Nocardia cyriacigeorgica]|uniref:ESX secretion-associated protein EspG n=1 Tax=Nocardia cyriacigeorgica TaxID=135487 RepID=UPI0024545478|nr:ESX secretion-associated protein EspG [Nocardia cyriacigeorgica]
MSEPQWRMDGLMFTLAVNAFGRDRLPYPIKWEPERRDPAEPVGYDEYERMRRDARQRLAGIADQRLHHAISTLLEPEVRVEVHGFVGQDFRQVVRIHAGLTARAAAMAVQLPGPTQAYGRDVVLSVLPPQALASRIVAHLPKCAAGKYEGLRARGSDVSRVEYAQHPTRLSLTEKINRIVRRPRSGLGEVGVYAGGAIDARPTPDVRGFTWMDYQPVDGRYLLQHHQHDEFTLAPAAFDEIVRALQHTIDTTRRSVAPAW